MGKSREMAEWRGSEEAKCSTHAVAEAIPIDRAKPIINFNWVLNIDFSRARTILERLLELVEHNCLRFNMDYNLSLHHGRRRRSSN